jgi:hypothetical protein
MCRKCGDLLEKEKAEGNGTRHLGSMCRSNQVTPDLWLIANRNFVRRE